MTIQNSIEKLIYDIHSKAVHEALIPDTWWISRIHNCSETEPFVMEGDNIVIKDFHLSNYQRVSKIENGKILIYQPNLNIYGYIVLKNEYEFEHSNGNIDSQKIRLRYG